MTASGSSYGVLMSLDELTCASHGWFAHFGVHEAGHATAATLLEFAFVEITINSGDDVFRQLVDGVDVIGAGVVMPTDRPTDWFKGREDDALVYVLAGSLAEDEILGHHLDGGASGDMDVWRRGTGRTGPQDPTELRPLMAAAAERSRTLVHENRAAVLRVYGLMTDRVSHEGRRHDGLGEELVVSSDEVHNVVLDLKLSSESNE